jgi:hypothetical protein
MAPSPPAARTAATAALALRLQLSRRKDKRTDKTLVSLVPDPFNAMVVSRWFRGRFHYGSPRANCDQTQPGDPRFPTIADCDLCMFLKCFRCWLVHRQ